MKQHKQVFNTWLMVKDIPHGETIYEQTIKGLASRPSHHVMTWQTYDISGFTICTKSNKKSMSQNSGVRCKPIDDETGEIITYFGFIEDIWEVDCGTFQILVFQCQWIEDKQFKVDNYGVRVLDLSKVGYKDDSWILANHVAQVFYAEQIIYNNEKKSTNKLKQIVFPIKQQAIGLDGVADLEDFNQFNDMSHFIDHPTNIRNVERSIPCDSLP
jgi:hypothetical protein